MGFLRSLRFVFGVVCFLQCSSVVHAEPSTVFGGALLRQGDVTLSGVIGFPDLFFQFDFANSVEFNFAFRARLNYNIGLPLFGAFGFVTLPMRLALMRSRDFSMALLLEPGLFLGGRQMILPLLLGFHLGLGLLCSSQIVERFQMIYGIEIGSLISFDTTNTVSLFGFHLPIELMVGGELLLPHRLSLFLKLSGGPLLYTGNLARRLSGNAYDVWASGSFRFLLGLMWRR